MSLIRIAWRYFWIRPLITLFTLIGIALGAGLISGVLTLKREIESSFVEESAYFDLVVGAKGSPLQLTLSSVYHMDLPTGNIPISRFWNLRKDFRVKNLAPLGLGDSYAGFRIVGTTPEFFDFASRAKEDQPSEKYYPLGKGRLFERDFEAVVGAQVAAARGLKIGSTFVGGHGLVSAATGTETETHDAFPYEVVGILESTGTSADRVIWVPISSVWKTHEAEYGEPDDASDPKEEVSRFPFVEPTEEDLGSNREVTAILLQLRAPGMRFMMSAQIQKGTESMAAIPINEMLRLYQNILTPFQTALLSVGYLVALVSTLSVATTLYQAMERRRQDVATMRLLGAHPREILWIALLETCFLSIIGVGFGFLIGHAGLELAAGWIRNQYGVNLSGWSVDAFELKALGIVLAMGWLAGLAPAVFHYRKAPADELAGR